MDNTLYTDSCVKVTLCHIERVVKTKKTSVKRGVIDPVFNETLSFNVTPDQLHDVTLVVTVLSRTGRGLGGSVGGGGGGIGGDDSIGRVLMVSHSSRGSMGRMCAHYLQS